MRKRLFPILAVFLMFLPTTVMAMDLTGVWTCDDGGSYYLRQFGNEIWWYGEQSPTNPAWSNIAHGTTVGNTITLNWTDVPKGRNMNHGQMLLEVTGDGKIVAKTKTGGFGGSVWTRAGR